MRVRLGDFWLGNLFSSIWAVVQTRNKTENRIIKFINETRNLRSATARYKDTYNDWDHCIKNTLKHDIKANEQVASGGRGFLFKTQKEKITAFYHSSSSTKTSSCRLDQSLRDSWLLFEPSWCELRESRSLPSRLHPEAKLGFTTTDLSSGERLLSLRVPLGNWTRLQTPSLGGNDWCDPLP